MKRKIITNYSSGIIYVGIMKAALIVYKGADDAGEITDRRRTERVILSADEESVPE